MGAFLSWSPKSGPAKSMFFDVVTEESQELMSTATEHPVEDGANVSDHVKRELDRVTLEVFVSNHPIYDLNDRGGKVSKVDIKFEKYKPPFSPTPGAVYSAVGSAISGLFSGNKQYAANVLQWDDSFDAVADAISTLEKLKTDVQLVTVVTPVKLYENMFLEKIEVRRNRSTGSGARINLSFREIRKVQVSIVNAPKPTEVRGNVTKPKGAQGPEEASPSGSNQSILKAGIDFIKAKLKGN